MRPLTHCHGRRPDGTRLTHEPIDHHFDVVDRRNEETLGTVATIIRGDQLPPCFMANKEFAVRLRLDCGNAAIEKAARKWLRGVAEG